MEGGKRTREKNQVVEVLVKHGLQVRVGFGLQKGREEGMVGGREGGKEGGMEGGMVRGRVGGKEGGREGRRVGEEGYNYINVGVLKTNSIKVHVHTCIYLWKKVYSQFFVLQGQKRTVNWREPTHCLGVIAPRALQLLPEVGHNLRDWTAAKLHLKPWQHKQTSQYF